MTQRFPSFLIHDESADLWRVWSEPVATAVATTPEQVAEVVARVEEAAARNLWAVGFLAYEAGTSFDPAFPQRVDDTGEGFPLAFFAFFTSCQVMDDMPAPGNDPRAGKPPADNGKPASLFSFGPWQADISREHYNRHIADIHRRIARGETYQVNYSFRQHARFGGDPAALFRRLVEAQEPGLSAFLDIGRFAICSASPELFFKRSGERIVCRPMKGTAARGLDCAADGRQRQWLAESAKNRAENLMIVDMVRNDLGRIAVPGTVAVERLFDLERYPSVWQMTSTVSARSQAGLTSLFAALFPCASITGAPKVQTMKIIDRLERSPRGVYTGAIGYVAPGGDCQFSVAIRTAVVDRKTGTAEYGVGGGVVWDSTAAGEFDECLAKTAVLSRNLPEFSLVEALLWTPAGGFYLYEEHLRRLADSADYFDFTWDENHLRKALETAVGEAQRPSKVRLVLDRRGQVEVETIPLDDIAVPARPVLGLALRPVRSDNLFLYHKTTCRQIYANTLAAQPRLDDVVLWNERGELTESCSCNIILELAGRLYTPPVDCGLLPGILRQKMLAEGAISERILTLQDFHEATSIQLVNSVRGVRTAIKASLA